VTVAAAVADWIAVVLHIAATWSLKIGFALCIDDSLSTHHYFADSYCLSDDTAAAAAVVVAVAPVSPLTAVSNEWETSPNPINTLPCVHPDRDEILFHR